MLQHRLPTKIALYLGCVAAALTMGLSPILADSPDLDKASEKAGVTVDLTAAFAKIGRKATSKVTIQLPIAGVAIKPDEVLNRTLELMDAQRTFRLSISKAPHSLKFMRKRDQKSALGTFVKFEVDAADGFIAQIKAKDGKLWYSLAANSGVAPKLKKGKGKKGKRSKKGKKAADSFGCDNNYASLEDAMAGLNACRSIQVTE